jgi:hypothetical protein
MLIHPPIKQAYHLLESTAVKDSGRDRENHSRAAILCVRAGVRFSSDSLIFKHDSGLNRIDPLVIGWGKPIRILHVDPEVPLRIEGICKVESADSLPPIKVQKVERI